MYMCLSKERWSLRQRRRHRLQQKVQRIEQKALKRQTRAEESLVGTGPGAAVWQEWTRYREGRQAGWQDGQ